MLMEVISPDQLTFLPLRFILDNLLIMQETMAWAEASNQPLIFLKLDFSKAYDMVDWQCMYKILYQHDQSLISRRLCMCQTEWRTITLLPNTERGLPRLPSRSLAVHSSSRSTKRHGNAGDVGRESTGHQFAL